MTALLWGYIADQVGRRLVLCIGTCGRLLAMLWIMTVGWLSLFLIRIIDHSRLTIFKGFWNDVLPIELVLLAPLLKLAGGGSRVFSSIIFAIVSDITSVSQR
jgi:MFS family permease